MNEGQLPGFEHRLPYVPSQEGRHEGVKRRNRGHRRVLANSIETFTVAAWKAWRTVCCRQRLVTSDDLWAQLDGRTAYLLPDLVKAQANVIGAIIRESARKGWTRGTNESRKTARANGHARRILVWESQIVGQWNDGRGESDDQYHRDRAVSGLS
jgi:hypothetical protein